MTQEAIKKLDALRDSLYQINRQLAWLESWGETLKNAGEEKFRATITDAYGETVLEYKIPKRDVERMYREQLECIQVKKATIQKEIDEL